MGAILTAVGIVWVLRSADVLTGAQATYVPAVLLVVIAAGALVARRLARST